MSRFLRPAYQGLEAYTPGEQPRVQNLIKLNTNENPYPPSPLVLEAINQTEVSSLRLYSDPTAQALVQAIADFHDVAPEQVSVSNGSDEALAFSLLAFGGDGAVFPDITYGFYPVWSALFQISNRIVPLKEDFSVDVDALCDPTGGMLLLANPNAPTGRALSRAQIEKILRARTGHVVLVDEAYVDFGAESVLPLLNSYDNLLIVRTFSKSRSLAGARIGYTLASRALTEDLNKMKFSFNPYNLNRLSILAGAAAMRDRAYFEKTREMIISDREFLSEALTALNFTVLPSRANFLFARPNGMDGARYVQALREHNILVRHFDKPRIREFSRISIGTHEEMQTLVSITREILKAEGRP